MSVFKDIKALHTKFGFKSTESPQLLPIEYMNFRISFIREELDELIKAHNEDDFEEVIDALIDIMYVAAGTLDLMGLDGDVHWLEVHQANMKKEAVKDASESKRSFGQDLKKPKGWKKPNHLQHVEGED